MNMYLSSIFTNSFCTISVFRPVNTLIKLVISGHYSSSSGCIPVLIQVQLEIQLEILCIQVNLRLSLPTRTSNKTDLEK